MHPFPIGCELLIGAPVRPRLARLPHFFEGDRKIEVGIRVERVQAKSFAIAPLCFGKTAEVVVDVSEVEVGLEDVRLEADRLACSFSLADIL